MAFRKPSVNKIGGKFLVYGMEHEGKSWFGLTFPEIAAIDSEVGLSFEEGRDIEINNKTYNNLVLVDTTADLDELEENLEAIIDGEVDCKTLLIDSETKFYNSMDIGATEFEEKKAKQNGKNADVRAKWGRIKQLNMKLQQAKLTLSSKGIHIVSTAQATEVKDKEGKVVLGYKPDVHKSLAFDYDVILRFYTVLDKKTKERKFYCEVEKDRTHITTKGDVIENATYDIWREHFEGRGGKPINANFSNDLKKSISSVMNGAEKSTELAIEIKELIKNSKEHITEIKGKLDELSIDIKTLDLTEVDKLMEIKKFIKSLN